MGVPEAATAQRVPHSSWHVSSEASRQARAQSCAVCPALKGLLWWRGRLRHWAQATCQSCHSESRHCHCGVLWLSIASCEARLPRSYPRSGAASGLHKLAIWLVSPSPPCLSCARSSSSCREKQQVCRLRGFRPRKLRCVTSQFQRHRCCAQLPPASVSHGTSYLEGSSMFRAAALAQGRNMTSRTPRTLCHLVAIARPNAWSHQQRALPAKPCSHQARSQGRSAQPAQPGGEARRDSRMSPQVKDNTS